MLSVLTTYSSLLIGYFSCITQLQSEGPHFYVAVNDSHESQMFASDLSEECLSKYRTGLIYASLPAKVVVINHLDIVKCREHRVPELDHYPSFRIGRYGEWEKIDKRSCLAHTFPLLTIRHHILDYYNEENISKWKRRCGQLESISYWDWIADVERWIKSDEKDCPDYYTIWKLLRGPDHLQTEEDIRKAVSTIVTRSLEGFPSRKPPELPPKPVAPPPPYERNK